MHTHTYIRFFEPSKRLCLLASCVSACVSLVLQPGFQSWKLRRLTCRAEDGRHSICMGLRANSLRMRDVLTTVELYKYIYIFIRLCTHTYSHINSDECSKLFFGVACSSRRASIETFRTCKAEGERLNMVYSRI